MCVRGPQPHSTPHHHQRSPSLTQNVVLLLVRSTSMVAVGYQPSPIAALSCLLVIFPFFRSVKAFSSVRVTARHGRRDANKPQFTQLKTSIIHPPPSTTGNVLMTLSPSALASQTSSVVSSKDDNEVFIRILCLHGKGGNGPKFVNFSLKPLRSLVEQRAAALINTPNTNDNHRLSFHWEELTAPYEILSGEDAGGYMWWTMPEGVRSYNAKEVRRYNYWICNSRSEQPLIFSSDLISKNMRIHWCKNSINSQSMKGSIKVKPS